MLEAISLLLQIVAAAMSSVAQGDVPPKLEALTKVKLRSDNLPLEEVCNVQQHDGSVLVSKGGFLAQETHLMLLGFPTFTKGNG